MSNPTAETRVLRVVHLAATGAATAAGMHADAPWWLWALVLVWGLVTGVWAFSAGWDAALGRDSDR